MSDRFRTIDELELGNSRSGLESRLRTFQQAGLSPVVALLISLLTSTIAGQENHTWSHVQTMAGNSVAGSNSVAFASATQPGNLIIAEVDWSDGSDFVSITDSQSNPYTQIGTEQHSSSIGIRSRLYYAANIRGGPNTVTTVVSGAPVWHELYLHEYSGLDLISPLDTFSVNVGLGATFTGGAIATSSPHELLYGIEIDSNVGSAIAGWTTRSTLDGNVTADGDAATGGSYAFMGNSAGAFIAWTVAFRQSSSPAPPPDITPPSAPSGVSASAISASEVDVSWTPSTDVDNTATEITYNVFRDGSKVGSTSGGATTYRNTGLAPATTYSYSVFATDPAGNTSAMSDSSQATTQDLPVPIINFFLASPSSVTAGLASTLSWQVSNATSVSIDNGVGSVTGLTSITVSPMSSVVYHLTAINGNGTATAQATIAVTQPPSESRAYATTFAAPENPISEGGRWINGKAVGLDWSDVATVTGLAFGTQTGSDGFDDSIAILEGNWGPDQSATAAVHVAKQPGPSDIHEVEILLRWTMSAHNAQGYEINFATTGQYVEIVRWNGPLGHFTYLDSEPLPNPLNDGDIVKATIVGQVITAFVNGVQVAQATDDSYSGGSPGMGFYLQGSDPSGDFGFTSYLATSQASSSWTHVQSTARNSGDKSNAVELPAATRSGDLIVVEVDWSNRSNFVSISDSQGNAFTQIGTEQESSDFGIKSRLYYAANINGGPDTVITAVSGSPAYHEVYLHEYSGLDPRSPVDAFSVEVARGTTFTSGTTTTTASHDLLFGIEIDSATATAAADWTTRSTLNSNVSADRDAPSVGNYAFTGQSTGASIAWIVAFKQSDGRPPPPSPVPTSSAESSSGETTHAVTSAPGLSFGRRTWPTQNR